MLVKDRLTIHDKRRTGDGYLVTEARFARSGIYKYAGKDVGKPDMPEVAVFRSEDEVFNADTMASFAHKPVTNEHPDDNVDSRTWKRDAVGFSDGRVARDGDFMVIPMMVADQNAIEDVDGGKRELSAGYTCDLEFVDGQAPDGSHYDAVMRNIRGNHIAIVDRGRAGSECRIGDSFEQVQEIEMQLKTILVDGLSVETTPAGEQAIVKLQGDLQRVRDAAATAETAHATALAGKDTELATKDATIADLQGKVLDGAALDTLVADRAALVATATKLVTNYDAKGKDAATIKREVVLAKRGEAAVKDKSAAYIDAAFDLLTAEGGGSDQQDTLADAIRNGAGTGPVIGTTMSVADAQRDEAAAFAQSTDFNGWRTKQPEAAAAA